MNQELATSGKVIAALTVLEGETEPAELFRFGPEEWADPLTHYAGVLKSRFARGKARELAELLRSWTERSPALPVHQIHPGWILEIVKAESPRIIGLVCRYLPGNHVRYLIENLPREQRDKLPTLSESFGMPAELMEGVKAFLASRFFHGTPPNPEEQFSVRHIPWMSAKDLRRLIRELGYRELRSAFSGLRLQAIKALLTRFPLDEAKVIREHIESGPPVPAALRKRAQEHIVALNLAVARAEQLPIEIGLSVLADAVQAKDMAKNMEWIEGVVVRLEPSEGYALRRYVREAIGRQRPEQSVARGQDLMAVIRDLAERGEIAQYWQGRMDEETTKSEKDTDMI